MAPGAGPVPGERLQADAEPVIEVKITPERGGGFNRLAERLSRFEEVESCYLMSGSYDLLIFVSGPSLQRVAGFVSEKLSTLEGVLSTSTHFMLRSYKEGFFLLLEAPGPGGTEEAQGVAVKRFIAKHVGGLPKSGIRDFFEIVSKMKDVISLGIGEPDFDTPWHIREAAIYALEKGKTHYTSNLGLLELRRAISIYVERHLCAQLHRPEDEIIVTIVGVSGGDRPRAARP